MTKYIFPVAATLISLLLVFEPHKIVRAAFWPGLVIAIWFSWRESRSDNENPSVSATNSSVAARHDATDKPATSAD